MMNAPEAFRIERASFNLMDGGMEARRLMPVVLMVCVCVLLLMIPKGRIPREDCCCAMVRKSCRMQLERSQVRNPKSRNVRLVSCVCVERNDQVLFDLRLELGGICNDHSFEPRCGSTSESDGPVRRQPRADEEWDVEVTVAVFP